MATWEKVLALCDEGRNIRGRSLTESQESRFHQRKERSGESRRWD